MAANPPAPTPTRAMRLVFEYEGDQVRLVMQQPVEMVVTGFDLTRTTQPGYYVDTRDAGEQTLARVAARNAFETSAEVFPEQPGEPIIRVEQATPRGAFTVVVPMPDRADHVTIVAVAPSSTAAPTPGARATAGGTVVNDLVSFSLGVRP